MSCDGLEELRLRQRESGTRYSAEDTYEYESVRTTDERRALGSGAYENTGGKWNSHLTAPI